MIAEITPGYKPAERQQTAFGFGSIGPTLGNQSEVEATSAQPCSAVESKQLLPKETTGLGLMMPVRTVLSCKCSGCDSEEGKTAAAEKDTKAKFARG